MEDNCPFGYTHRNKRSHAQMEEDRSASPVWYSNHLAVSRDQHSSLPFYRSFEQPRAESTEPPTNLNLYAPRGGSNQPPHLPLLRPTPASAARPDMSGLHLPWIENMASSAPRRFAGDGFDYRRPAGSEREQNSRAVDSSEEDDGPVDLSRDGDVIDLTADDSGYGPSQDENVRRSQGSNEGRHSQPADRHQRTNNGSGRLPRGMDIIIDLDSGEEEWRAATPPALEPGSPEIEFVSSRRLDAPQHRSNSDGDEVQFLRENPLPEAEARRRLAREQDHLINLLGTMNGRFTHLRQHVDRFHAAVNQTAAQLMGPVPPTRRTRARARNRAHVQVGFAAPMLDFGMVGFDMGMGPPRVPEPPVPTYQAPETASEGFTRSPQEEDVLLCPNCGEELCAGDDDTKRQVWIVKSCGHVYCGECTANRSVKRSSKGKEKPARTKPFKECVITDCGKKVTNPKAMIQIFL